jgi:hypothetical protein
MPPPGSKHVGTKWPGRLQFVHNFEKPVVEVVVVEGAEEETGIVEGLGKSELVLGDGATLDDVFC